MTSLPVYGTLRILDSTGTIKTNFLKAVMPELQASFNKINPNPQIRAAFADIMSNDPIIRKFASGAFDADFGFTPGQAAQAMTDIITSLSAAIQFKFEPLRLNAQRITGGLSVYIMKNDFVDILSLPGMIIATDKFSLLEWLDWLLFEGSRVIIAGYEIRFGNFSFARSGQAIMVPKASGHWNVPNAIAGTANDNILTRALTNNLVSLELEVSKIFEQELAKVL